MNNEDIKPRITLAKELARKLLKDAGVTRSPIILNDIFKHLKRTYSLKIIPFTLGKKTSGIQANQDGVVTIAYNSGQHLHRQRFTVAHEIGHLLLGHTHSGLEYDFNSKHIPEIEANCFASELLMPQEMLKTDYLMTEANPKILALNYQVSEQSMWIRLMECNLIK